MLSRRAVLGALAASALRGDGGREMFGDAEAYERFMGRWSSLLAPSLVNFAEVRDSGRILDVGSGTGALAFAIGKLRPHCRVVGIDPAEEYIRYAAHRNPFPDRIRFRAGDAQALAFENSTFESSVSLLVFNFIPDRRKALSEAIRVTKAGGSVAAAVWDYRAGMRMLRAFWDAAVAVDPSARKLDEAHMPLCRAGEMEAFFRDGGLQQVAERPLDITMRFASFADYWDPFLLGQGPAGVFLGKLDGARRRALREELKGRLAVTAEETPFSLPARAWAVRGIVV